MERIHKDKKYECGTCNKFYANLKFLQMHEIKAHGTKTYTCDDCDSAFVDQSGLNRHVRLVHEKRRDYKCDLCNETFQTT